MVIRWYRKHFTLEARYETGVGGTYTKLLFTVRGRRILSHARMWRR